MTALIDRLARPAPMLWLDSHAYAARLLARGSAPWLDIAAYVAWQRKVAGLLRPDVLPVPLAGLWQAWITAHAELAADMASRRRTLAPLKTLLADAGMRAHAIELVGALRAGISLPLALVLPTPRAAVAWACERAFDAAPAFGEDEADSAAVYLADFLRGFGDSGVDAVLLEEATGFAPAAADLACYQSVLNVAAHFRWDTGLRLCATRSAAPADGYAFALGANAWENAHPGSGLRYVEIPADADPEQVLARLEALR